MLFPEIFTEEKYVRGPAGHSGITAGPAEEQPDPEIKQSPFCIRRFCGNQKTAARRDTGRDKKPAPQQGSLSGIQAETAFRIFPVPIETRAISR